LPFKAARDAAGALMKKAIVIQHMEHDHIGRFAEYFAEDGIIPTTVRPFKGEAIPPLRDFDLMFVLGGAQNTWEQDKFEYLVAETLAVKEWVSELVKPYFGICLGHQMLADAMGGRVGEADKAEVGVFDVVVKDGRSLLAGLPVTMKVMQWHHAEVQAVPEGARVLAQSSTTSVQALQIGTHAFSTQFHCEFTPQAVLGWAAMPTYIAAMERELGEDAHARVVEQCWPHMPAMARHTRMLWENFKRVTKL
jgi:GMP synthase-like glutamine amidotransferase